MKQLFKHSVLCIVLSLLLFQCSENKNRENTEKVNYKIVCGVPIADYLIFRNIEQKFVTNKDWNRAIHFWVISDLSVDSLKVYVLKFPNGICSTKCIAEIYKKDFNTDTSKINLIAKYELCKKSKVRIDKIYNEFKPQEMCSIDHFSRDMQSYTVRIVSHRVNCFSVVDLNLNKLDDNSEIAKEPQVVFLKTIINFFNDLKADSLSKTD